MGSSVGRIVGSSVDRRHGRGRHRRGRLGGRRLLTGGRALGRRRLRGGVRGRGWLRRRRRRGLARRSLGGLGLGRRGAATAAATPAATGARAAAGRDGAAAARAVRDGEVVAGDVGVVERQHQVDVLVAVVVAEDRGPPARVGGEVVVTGAEVDRGRQGRVVDVLRVALGVAVGVDAHDGPRGGDELHRADRAVELRVVVEQAGVGVADARGALGAVERQPVDGRSRQPLARQVAAVHPTVVGLDPADRRDQLPGQVAGGVGGVDHGLGPLVRRQGGRRDPVDGGVADGRVGVAQHAGRELGAGRQARRRLDGLLGNGAAVGQRAVGARAGGSGPAVRGRDAHAPGGREQGQRHEGGGALEAAEPHIRHRGSLLLHLPGSADRVLSLTRRHPSNEGWYPRVTRLNPDCDLGHTRDRCPFTIRAGRRGRRPMWWFTARWGQ